MRNASPFIAPLLVLAGAASARAASFDPATGKIVLTGSAYTEPFDAVPAGLSAFGARNQPLSSDALQAAIVHDPSAAIEGTGALEIGGTVLDGFLDLRPLAQTFAGRRVEARFWQLAKGTRAHGSILWVSGSADALLHAADFRTPFILSEVSFQPTGRATDDGWEEWTTGPFDFSAGAMLAPAAFSFYDATLSETRYGIGKVDPAGRVRIDGFTVDDLGPAAVPSAACTLLNEASSCGPNGMCMYGRCTDAALAFGPKLENVNLRTQYLSRRVFEFETFEGGRVPLSRMPAFQTAVMQLAAPGVTNAQYWTSLSGAIQDLEDGHAHAPIPVFRSQIFSGVCMHMGDPDLLPSAGPGTSPRPLVFSAPSTNPIGMMVQKGDALMSIDGASVADWSHAARRDLEYHGDPAAREVVTAPAIIDAAIKSGATLELARCPQTSTSSIVPATACSQGQVTTIRIDLAAIEADVWTGSPPSWRNDYDTCDFRFRRAVDTTAGKDYAFAGFIDDRDVRWVQFNGVPSQYQMGGQQWFDTMTAAFSSSPAKILLDERLGDGGAIQTVDLLASFLLAASDAYSAEMMPQLGQPITDALRQALRACNESGSQTSDCGGFFEWLVGQMEPTRGAASASKVAVLLGQDVSGNDFITKMITYRQAPTRIFGAAPTFGAFGVIWGLPSIAGEAYGGSLQAQDSIFRRSASDPTSTFSTSSGIPPDVVILEKQSDAVRNVDTAVEAAKAWLRQ